MSTPAKVLVVDDTPHNVKLLADLLAVKGYGVATATNGEEALAKIAAEAPDLVLLGGDKVMAASRTPDIYADAAYQVLLQPAGSYTGQTLIVEDVLEAAGVTDFSGYAAIPGTPDAALFPDIFLG